MGDKITYRLYDISRRILDGDAVAMAPGRRCVGWVGQYVCHLAPGVKSADWLTEVTFDRDPRLTAPRVGDMVTASEFAVLPAGTTGTDDTYGDVFVATELGAVLVPLDGETVLYAPSMRPARIRITELGVGF